MSKEVLDSSLDEPKLEALVAKAEPLTIEPEERTVCGSSIAKLTPAVEVTVAPQPVPFMKDVNGHVYDMISSIASLMKPEAEKKLGKSFIIFDPVYYMKKKSINYCLRVKVDGDQLIDVTGNYAAGAVSKVKAKEVTKDDGMAFW